MGSLVPTVACSPYAPFSSRFDNYITCFHTLKALEKYLYLLEVLKLGGSLKNPSFECHTITFKAGSCMNPMEKFDYKSNI